MNNDQPLVRVTFDMRIHDVRAFIRAARKQAVTEGYTEADAKKEFCAQDLGACAVMLMDPGISPEGSQILDSETEVQ